MEAFDFAVGLGPIWAGAAMLDVTQRITEGARSVAGTVVCHNLSSDDAVSLEPGVGAQSEAGCGLLAFIG